MSNITMSNTDPGEGSSLANDNFIAVYGGTSLLDMFYPVGTYYETSDTTFDPNVKWGGVWQKDTTGKVTIAQDSGSFATVGNVGGAETHRHDFKIGMYSYFGAWSGDDWTSGAVGNGAYSYSQNTFSKEISRNSSGSGRTQRNNAAVSALTEYDEGWLRISKGDTDTGSSLPPYIVVVRWHRTA